jgi:hypothetical protein
MTATVAAAAASEGRYRNRPAAGAKILPMFLSTPPAPLRYVGGTVFASGSANAIHPRKQACRVASSSSYSSPSASPA